MFGDVVRELIPLIEKLRADVWEGPDSKTAKIDRLRKKERMHTWPGNNYNQFTKILPWTLQTWRRHRADLGNC